MRSFETIFSVTILITLATSIKAIMIECNFTTFSDDDSIHLTVDKSSNVYGCVVVGFSDLSKPEITINGIHANLRGNDDVVGVSVADKNFGDLLNNIGGVFVNIREILIRNCLIRGIKFDGFEKLEILVIVGSDLEEIGEKFFDNNQNLSEIQILKNEKLTKIDHRAFEGLKKLKTLDLDDNFCTNGETLDQNDVNGVLSAIKVKCESQKLVDKIDKPSSSPSGHLESNTTNFSSSNSMNIASNDLSNNLHSISTNQISTNVHMPLNHSKLLNESSIPQNSSTKIPNEQILTPSTQKSNLDNSKNPTTTSSGNSNTPNVIQSIGNSEIRKQSIDIKTNEKSTSESCGNGKAIAICVMFGAVVILMGAAIYVKQRQMRNYDGVLLIDNMTV